ncbi:MAG: flagellar assembly protein FliH [Methylococcales bacterium]|nr:flagellar assembly protein FliH [Methylobacter sp.]MDZ4157913.1 flagellar assembly protein FliH [Methylococcales bacterium]MDP2097852.1 flagellar assembly protein FliH [Methylobacter sp.]MDP2426574.1 flagellar assembly protein FliH [Methylobacter sp.]MDP3056739.1 flagellar assembly protein FliH [Methylobacter sp.]
MSSSRTPRFTAAELESLRLWSLPDVSGVDEFSEPEMAEPEQEPTPILTVDEIEVMQRQAYDEAFAQGKMHGFQQGFDEGSKKGYEDNLHLLQTQATGLARLLESLAEPFKRLDDEVEKELVKLVIGVATQIIRREIKLDPGQIIAVVRESVNVLPLASQKISLQLHPDDADLVRSALALDEMSPSWDVIEDPLITRGGCKVNTEVSSVDATVEHRLAAVIANLLGGERERDGMAAHGNVTARPPVAEAVSDNAGLKAGQEGSTELMPEAVVEGSGDDVGGAPTGGALADAGTVEDKHA